MAGGMRVGSHQVAIHAPLAGGDPDRSNVLPCRSIEGEIREPHRPSDWRYYRSIRARPINRAGPRLSAGARSSRKGHESCKFARAELSSDERVLKVYGGTRTVVLDSTPPATPKHVETQTVLGGVNEIQQVQAEPRPLLPSDLALEDRILDALAEVQTLLGHLSEATPTRTTGGRNVIGYKNHHGVISSGTGDIHPGPPAGDGTRDGLGDGGEIQPSSAPRGRDG